MTRPKLTYFDAPVSRGEECRLALVLAGVDFEDVRIKFVDWPALKPTSPYGALPIFEAPGHPPLAQTNAILVLIGRLHGLHPKDAYEAAQHEAMMQHVEDLRVKVSPTIHITDLVEKQKVREELVASYLPTWAALAEKHIASDGLCFGGTSPQVVDVKLHMAVRWFAGGKVDHIPATIFSGFPRLIRVHDLVRDHALVKAWYARTA